MPRYVIDLPVELDCKDCPFFGRHGDYTFGRGGRCSMAPITVYDNGEWVDDVTYVSKYPRPRNCPLEPVQERGPIAVISQERGPIAEMSELLIPRRCLVDGDGMLREY